MWCSGSLQWVGGTLSLGAPAPWQTGQAQLRAGGKTTPAQARAAAHLRPARPRPAWRGQSAAGTCGAAPGLGRCSCPRSGCRRPGRLQPAPGSVPVGEGGKRGSVAAAGAWHPTPPSIAQADQPRTSGRPNAQAACCAVHRTCATASRSTPAGAAPPSAPTCPRISLLRGPCGHAPHSRAQAFAAAAAHNAPSNSCQRCMAANEWRHPGAGAPCPARLICPPGGRP